MAHYIVRHLVEMSGFEPESERFAPRMSTSVVDHFLSLEVFSIDEGEHLANR